MKDLLQGLDDPASKWGNGTNRHYCRGPAFSVLGVMIDHVSKTSDSLLIDDSEATVEGLRSYLIPRFDVVTACNGLEGLKVFEEKENRPDLVITDLVMPLVSGIGLISLLKKQSPGTPIIAMTGWGKYPQELATEVNADTILMKPFDLEELDQSMDKLLVNSIR
jgi:YesN/AraC family two-component response regulator